MKTQDALQLALDEYGAADVNELRAVVVRRPGPPRPIKSAQQYCAALYTAAQYNEDPEVADRICDTDPRLLYPLWQDVPVRPSDHGRILNWLDFWNHTQRRPNIVGSSHNTDPSIVAACWRLGLPAWACRRLRAHDWPDSIPKCWNGHRTRIRAMLALGDSIDTRNMPTLRTAELRRLAKLPAWVRRVLRAHLPTSDDKRNVDWPAVAELVALLRPHHEELDRLKVPVPHWADAVRADLLPVIRAGALDPYQLWSHNAERLRWYYYASDDAQDTWELIPRNSAQFARPYNIRTLHGWMGREHRRRLDDSWRAAIAKAPVSIDIVTDPEDGGLVGWRTWRLTVSSNAVQLSSPYRHIPWTRPHESSSPVPAENNTCGIYARWTREMTITADTAHIYHQPVVIGEVRGYGVSRVSPEGWRAEEMVIVSLHLIHPGAPPHVFERIMDRLAAYYGVAVTGENHRTDSQVCESQPCA